MRIPAAVMGAARFSLDQSFEVREKEGRIVIEPMHKASYDLGALVDAITDKDRHQAIQFGPAKGREVW